MEEAKKCPKCGTEMTKGLFVPSVGVVGMQWTDKLEYSKWKFEKMNKIKTFQYACKKCGFIETYLDK
jgi:predicted nucleic-acid-binding Zn-ribbon protein